MQGCGSVVQVIHVRSGIQQLSSAAAAWLLQPSLSFLLFLLFLLILCHCSAQELHVPQECSSRQIQMALCKVALSISTSVKLR